MPISKQTFDGLFMTSERWGWEFVDPPSPQPSPMLSQEPMWQEPPPLPPGELDPSRQRRARDGNGIIIMGILIILAIAAVVVLTIFLASESKTRTTRSFSAPVWLLPAFLGVCAVWWLAAKARAVQRRRAAQEVVDRWHHERQLDLDAFHQDVADWKNAIAVHDRRERERFERADVWYPLGLVDTSDRVDVVGGVPDGWRQLLTTFGSTVVARGLPLLVMDLTQDGIAAGLAEVCPAGRKVQVLRVPRDADRVDFLAGLTAVEAAEMLATAVESMRGTPDASLRATDTDVLRTVAAQLDGPLTTARLAAGIRVLQRAFDPEQVALTFEEVRKLTGHIDLIGTGDRVQEQLRSLRVALSMLDGVEPAEPADSSCLDVMWREADLTVIETDSSSPSTKDFVDRVLFYSLLQRLRSRAATVDGHVLVIAGADHLGAPALEAMARQARTRGIRLVYLFEHLRDDAHRLVGGSRSATIIMRLGHAAEASAAAEYIGRGHTLKISQITRQLGITDTLGGGTTDGTTTSESWGENTSSGASGPTSGRSYSKSISTMSQQLNNWSKGISNSRGTTEQRVYEFDVEPQEIQTLPVTAFILVEGAAGGRRTAVGDCNPAIASTVRTAGRGPTALPTQAGSSESTGPRPPKVRRRVRQATAPRNPRIR